MVDPGRGVGFQDYDAYAAARDAQLAGARKDRGLNLADGIGGGANLTGARVAPDRMARAWITGAETLASSNGRLIHSGDE